MQGLRLSPCGGLRAASRRGGPLGFPLSGRPSVRASAAYEFSKGTDKEAVASASATLQKCLTLIKERELDSLTDYLCNNVLESSPAIPFADGTESQAFEDIIYNMILDKPEHHFLDSYAIRNLILATPASAVPLSGLMLAPDRFLQRVAVTNASGEESVLTFTLTAQPVALPPSAGQATATELGAPAAAAEQQQQQRPQQPQASDVVWKLAAVKGEPSLPDLPEAPSPECSPESVVQASLQALKERNLAIPYSLLSPASQGLLGSSQERFAAAVRDNRRYSTLFGHLASSTIRRCQNSSNTYLELVACTSASGARGLFCYILCRQGADSPMPGCWCVEHVKVLDDPVILNSIDQAFWHRKSK